MTAGSRRPPPGEPAETGLLALLETERRALLAGELGELPELARKKETYLDLYAAQPSRLQQHAPRLLAALRHNQRLLGMALQGLTAAQGRLGTWQRLIRQMDTYDPNGRKTHIGPGPTGRIQKKL
ncbi:hypothetical protein LCM08_10560 [Salipiger pacificus]|nr:hypothetical protein [Alloyangia pacifica]MCA0945353.1 hypothetical protein [Alloyangia pacifica]